MTILEGNKLIAEFMGAKRTDTTQGFLYWFNKPPTTHANHQWDDFALQYHSSWDWIMPVVEEIESSADQVTGHCEFEIRENSCSIFQFSYIKPIQKVFNSKSKILAVWEAVVKFIQWYNQNKPQQNN